MSTETASPRGRNGRGPRVPLATPVPTPTLAREVPLSAPTPNLDAAVLRVQAQAAKLVRNADGQVGSRTYTYVTLTAVMDEVHPLLVEEQLVWKVFPTVLDEGRPGLRYTMTHVPSGESDQDTMPLLCDPTMQALGSGITYGRRYALIAYLALTVEEDDDGLSANTPVRDKYAEAAAAHEEREQTAACTTAQPTARPPKQTERRITANQRDKLLKPRAQKAGLTDGEFANVILGAAGDPPRQWRSQQHATDTLGRLLDQLPARLKDAVLEGITQAGNEKKERGS